MTHREYAGGIRQRRFRFEQIKMVLKARQHGFTLFVFFTHATRTHAQHFSSPVFHHARFSSIVDTQMHRTICRGKVFHCARPNVQIHVPKHVASGHWVFNLLANGKFGRKVNPLLKPPFVMHDVSKTKIETTMNWGPTAMHDSRTCAGLMALDGFGMFLGIYLILPFEVVSKHMALHPCTAKVQRVQIFAKFVAI